MGHNNMPNVSPLHTQFGKEGHSVPPSLVHQMLVMCMSIQWNLLILIVVNTVNNIRCHECIVVYLLYVHLIYVID